MKTKFFIGIAATLLMTSCDKLFTQTMDITIDPFAPDMTFSAVIENQPSTKTELEDNTSGANYYILSWTKGDAISISDGENTARFTTENSGTQSAKLTLKEGVINDDAFHYTAFYPSTITPDNMELPAEQEYVTDNVKDFPMYAQSENRELKFKNLCGIIRLSLKSEESGSMKVASISLSADDAGMSGDFTVGTDGSAIVSGNNGVILACKSPVSLYKTLETHFNIIVPPGNYNPLKVKILDTENKEINLVSEGNIQVRRSGITLIRLTLNTSSFDSSLEMIPITEADVEFTNR